MKRNLQKKISREQDYNNVKRILHKVNKIQKKKEERDKQIKHYMIKKYVKQRNTFDKK